MSDDVEESWRSLEPSALLVNLVPDLARTARSSWPILLAVLLGGGVSGIADLSLILLFFAMSAARTLTHLLTLRYRLARGRLELQSGLIGRQHRIIDPARIQNVTVVQNLFHRALGLAELKVETAGGEFEVEGQLSGMRLADAEALRAALASRVSVPTHGEEEPAAVTELGTLELLGYGMSSGRVGAAALIVGVLMEVIAQVRPSEFTTTLPPMTLLGLSFIAMSVAFVLSALGAMFTGWNYRLTRSTVGIRTESGLTTRRRIEIPWEKVQLVRAEEPILRQLLGYGTLFVETAATGVPNEAGTAAAEASVPMVATAELGEVATVLLPRLNLDPWRAALRLPATRALVRALIGTLFRWSVGLGILAALVRSPWPLVLLALGLGMAWLDWRFQGWALSDTVIVSRMGFPTRYTWVVDRRKLQTVVRTAGPLQRLFSLARVEVWVAGSRVVLPDLMEADADRLFDQLITPLATNPVR